MSIFRFLLRFQQFEQRIASVSEENMAVYKRTRPDFYICRKSGRSDCGVISTEKHCLPITQEIAELLQPSS